MPNQWAKAQSERRLDALMARTSRGGQVLVMLQDSAKSLRADDDLG